jgi:hypothetical protein
VRGKKKQETKKMSSMRVVRLACVDQGQHHKDESLQSDHQNVEQSPHRAANDVANGQTHTGC